MTGYDIEAAIIGILQQFSTLNGIEKNHQDDNEDVSPNSITVSATVGEKQLEGPGCYACECDITFRCEAGQAATDAIARAIRDAIQASPSVAANVRELSAFTRFDILDERASETRDDTDHLRVRTLNLPIEAL